MAESVQTCSGSALPRRPVGREPVHGGAPCVLMVDSHDMNRRMLKAMLRPASYAIRECRRGPEAIKVLQAEKIRRAA